MATKRGKALLTANDLPPVCVTNPDGGALFLLIGDHAGNRVPECLQGLGLSPSDLSRHIALDLGVAELGRALAAKLDATFAEQRYSRLVIDCNRWPSAPDSIAEMSDGTAIAGNAGLAPADRQSRFDAVFEPYHAAIAALIAARPATILVSLHSFTPVMQGFARPWEVGVLHDSGDNGFALATLVALRKSGLLIGDNEPYRMDSTDYTVPRHAYASRLPYVELPYVELPYVELPYVELPYVELEVRQDLLAEGAGVERIAAILADCLRQAAAG